MDARFIIQDVNGKVRFAPPLLAKQLIKEGIIEDGCYLDTFEEELRQRMTELLGDDWTTTYADATMKWLKQSGRYEER